MLLWHPSGVRFYTSVRSSGCVVLLIAMPETIVRSCGCDASVVTVMSDFDD